MNHSHEAFRLPEANDDFLANLNPADAPSDSLRKLGQFNRMTHLRYVRFILILLGVVTTFRESMIFSSTFIEAGKIENGIAQQMAEQEISSDQLNAQKAELRLIRIEQIASGGHTAIGVLMIVLGALVFRYPIVCTATILTLYLAMKALLLLVNPALLMNGIFITVGITLVLMKTVQIAAVYQRERTSLCRGE